MSDETTETTPTEEPTAEENSTSLFQNYISYFGFAIAAAALTSIVMLVILEFYATNENPYTDLITFIFVPTVMLFGLFIALVGAILERRRRRHAERSKLKPFPILDLNDPRRRRSFLVFLGLAFIFLFISAFGSYRAYEYTESVTFCGQACHVPMKPEFTAYQASPHARIRCVECHVGGGAKAYVTYKFNGLRQLWGVVTGHYERPIPSPVWNMREATATCEKCHWSEKYYGDQIRVFNHYEYDEQNSLNQTRLLVKVGGGSPDLGPVGGIHWHMNVANQLTFIAADEKRHDIPWVRLKDSTGKVTDYLARGSTLTAQQIAEMPQRKMDCIDCHNRPAHIYLSPNQAVDRSLDAGKLDISLPYLKAKAVETLAKPYNTEQEARDTIATDIDNYYKQNYADIYASKHDSITTAINELQTIYSTYFFPEMKTDWKAHDNNIGHYNAQGCFRCHDGQHFSSDGRVIRNECNVCHTTLDQTVAGKTTPAVNGQFTHPVNLGDKNTWQCAACHKGDRTFNHPVNLGDISRFQCADCHSGSYEKVKYQN
jgi:hypothetical protein